MIKNCICGLKRDPGNVQIPGKDSSFLVVSGITVDPKAGEMQVSTTTMFACRGCGVTYVLLAPENKVVLG